MRRKIDLTYIPFDNEQNKSTGGQNTYQAHLDYINIAKSSGFDVVSNVIKGIDDFESKVKNIHGLKFICIKCGLDNETPRPPLGLVRVKEF